MKQAENLNLGRSPTGYEMDFEIHDPVSNTEN